MEYERSSDGQIQAAMARRAGQLLLQYESMCQKLPVEEQFESTLAVALLQMMLTNCQEVMRRGSNRKSSNGGADRLNTVISRSIFDKPELMGLEQAGVVQCWPSTRRLTYREVFECLRNALSHPCLQGNTLLPATGFSTVKADSGIIESYVFTQSSWVNSKGTRLTDRYGPENKNEETREKLEEAMNSWAKNYAVGGLSVERIEGKWRVVREGQPFIPVLRLRLGIQQLRTFTMTLSDYLSESHFEGVGSIAA
jgi:hypothetical protein